MATAPNESSRNGRILVAGSMAFDFIMHFDGKFQDHILADKLDAINLSFLVNRARKERGGCAGNVAHALALLGEHPRVVAAVGSDFAGYEDYMRSLNIDVSCLRHFDDELTATCTITSDRCGNQLTFVSVGAMARAREISLSSCATENTAIALISPDDPQAMENHVHEARAKSIPFIYDPSFQVIAFTGQQLLDGVEGAKALVVNDYEFSLFLEKTGLSLDELRQRTEFVFATCGSKGSTVYCSDGRTLQVQPVPTDNAIDPTGAGDAYRAGLLYGLMRNLDLEKCAKLASVLGVYAVESVGTQNFTFTKEEFCQRYCQAYGQELCLQ